MVDLDAITANAAALVAHVRGAQVMAVVKSDGYGHGMVPTAGAAIAGGASWLGVVQIADALALRAAGITVPVLCLLGAPDARHGEAVAAGHRPDGRHGRGGRRRSPPRRAGPGAAPGCTWRRTPG